MLQAFQSRECGRPILVGAGERLLESVIAREDHRGAADLAVVLLDQLLKNLRAPVQAGVDLRARVLAVRVPNEKISRRSAGA